jgi:methanogenic corrinoid protein MtbC1
MGKPWGEAEYPIAAVSKLTGVSCHALRVWERRYGYPVPQRSPSGHRRYSHEQVLVLRRLSELSRTGRSIGDLIADTRAGRIAVEAEPEGGRAAPGEAELDAFLERMLAGDVAGANTCFERLEGRFGCGELVARVIGPALTETGERWFRRKCSVYQERCVSGFLRQKLAAKIDAARRANAEPSRTALLGTVQGDRHEGGVLIANLLLELAGWRVVNLGVDLPVPEFARAVEQIRPDALALSFVLSRNINKRFQELSQIRDVPVFVGGRSILNYQTLARRFGLIPVAGPAATAVAQLFQEFDLWPRRRPVEPEAG